jgi:hypothetical protein
VYAFLGVTNRVALVRAAQDAESTAADEERQVGMLNQAVGGTLGVGAAVIVTLAMRLGHVFIESVVNTASVLVEV